MRQFGSYLPLVLKGELRGANPSTRGLGWANLWCTGCYANSSAGQLSWYGRTAAPREILLYTSSRTRFLNRTSIGERCKHREVESRWVLKKWRRKQFSRNFWHAHEGLVWEESIVFLPPAIKMVFLSATMSNATEFAEWILNLHKQPCHVVYTDLRPTPLQHYVFPI